MSLSTLEDQMALRHLVSIYCSIVDDRDAGRMASLFAPGGQLIVYAPGARPGVDEPLRRWEGVEGFGRLIEALGRSYSRWIHFIGNHWVELDGDTASGETYCMASGETYCVASHLRDEPSGPTEEVNIVRYRDHYIRTDAGWRFKERHAYKQWGTIRPVSGEKHELDAIIHGREP